MKKVLLVIFVITSLIFLVSCDETEGKNPPAAKQAKSLTYEEYSSALNAMATPALSYYNTSGNWESSLLATSYRTREVFASFEACYLLPNNVVEFQFGGAFKYICNVSDLEAIETAKAAAALRSGIHE